MFSASLVVFALNVLYPLLGSEISDFSDWKKDALLMDRPMDGPTDRRMDRPSYRDAWTHLKAFSSGQIFHISHSGQIRSTFALSCYGDHFGPFWCTTWATPPPLYD